MKNPKVTIAVPILNEIDFIREALESLQNQSYKNIDVRIIDGGSTDGTLEILKKYSFPFETIPRLGQMASINKVWNESTSEYVTWMAGDDVLYPKAIENLVKMLENFPDASFAHGPADVIDGQGKLLFRRNACDIKTEDLLRSFCMLPQTGLIRRKGLQNSGLTNPSLRFAADHDLYLRLSFFGYGVAAKNSIAKFRIHEGSEDAKNFSEVGRQTVRIVEDIIQSDLGKRHLTSNQIKLGRSHALVVCGNFVISNSNRLEAFKCLVKAFVIKPLIIIDAKSIKLIIRLLTPFLVSPNVLRKVLHIIRR
jgi:glycosyltransferase involved in cell wall biosynthesis